MAEKMDPQVKALYNRIYDRSDLVPVAPLGRRLALGVAAVWLLCGAVNYLVLGRQIADHQTRVILALAYGPAFGPLHVAQAQGAVAVFGYGLPAGLSGLLLGGGAITLCALLAFVGQADRAHWTIQRREAQQYAATYQGRPLPGVVRRKLALKGAGLPFATIHGKVIGVPYGKDRGHVGVFAPSRSGKGLHLT